MTNMIFDQNRPKHVLLSVQNIVTTDTIYFPLFLIETNNRSNDKLLQPIKTEEFMTKKLVGSFPTRCRRCQLRLWLKEGLGGGGNLKGRNEC